MGERQQAARPFGDFGIGVALGDEAISAGLGGASIAPGGKNLQARRHRDFEDDAARRASILGLGSAAAGPQSAGGPQLPDGRQASIVDQPIEQGKGFDLVAQTQAERGPGEKAPRIGHHAGSARLLEVVSQDVGRQR